MFKISFCIVFTKFFVKHKGLSNARIAYNQKKNMVIHFFVKNHKFSKVNIRRIIKNNLLKLLFVWNFHDKTVFRI